MGACLRFAGLGVYDLDIGTSSVNCTKTRLGAYNYSTRLQTETGMDLTLIDKSDLSRYFSESEIFRWPELMWYF